MRRRLSIFTLSVGLLASVSLFCWANDSGGGGVANVWFGDLLSKSKLTTAKSLVQLPALARDAIQGGRIELEKLPEELDADSAPRIVFISVSDGKTSAKVASGSGDGIRAAMNDALARLRSRYEGSLPSTWVKVDVVQQVRPYVEDIDTALVPFERSLEGLAYGRKSRAAFTPEELVARTLVNSDGQLQRRNIAKYRMLLAGVKSDADLPPTDDQELVRFTTRGFFVADGEPVELYRGHAPRPTLTREVLLEVSKRGADYLRRSVRENGSFVYSYLPKSNAEKSSYNMVRHAGTIYSMLDIYETTKDPELLAAAERAIAYLLIFIKEWGNDNDGARIMTYGGKIKLGGVALTAVALAEHVKVTGKKDHLEIAQGLCRYMVKEQAKTGRFIHSRYYPSGAIGSHISQYYPGEALLGLLRVYSIDKNEEWLDAADRGARYLIEVRDKGIKTPDLTHDHWLLYALNELYRFRKNDLFLKHAMNIATAIELKQNRDPAFPDWFGSYYKPPRSTPTACRCEGMVAAYLMARDHGQKDRLEGMLENIKHNAGFQLENQLGPERALYCGDPQRALGGFTRGLTNFEVRIDYVQHNISALIGMYRLMGEDKREKL